MDYIIVRIIRNQVFLFFINFLVGFCSLLNYFDIVGLGLEGVLMIGYERMVKRCALVEKERGLEEFWR